MSPFNRALSLCSTDAARAVLRGAYWAARYPERRTKVWLAYCALTNAEKVSAIEAVSYLLRAGLRAHLPLCDPGAHFPVNGPGIEPGE